jgi:hypothetical protein
MTEGGHVLLEAQTRVAALLALLPVAWEECGFNLLHHLSAMDMMIRLLEPRVYYHVADLAGPGLSVECKREAGCCLLAAQASTAQALLAAGCCMAD